MKDSSFELHGFGGLNTKLKLLIIVCLILTIAFSFTHQPTEALNEVTGRVLDSNGRPLKASVALVAGFRILNSVETSEVGLFSFPLIQGATHILIFSNNVSTPGFDYVPAQVKIDSGSPLTIILKPAASIIFKGDIQFVETDNIASSVVLQVTDENGSSINPSGFPLSFGVKTSNILQIPSLEPYEVIVPAEIPNKIWVTANLLLGSKMGSLSFETAVLESLSQGELRRVDIRNYTIPYNIKVVELAINDVKPRLTQMERLGFYIVREKGIAARAEAELASGNMLFEEGRLGDAFDTLKRSYIDAKKAFGDLSALYLDASSSVYILVTFFALSSVTIAFLLSDRLVIQIPLSLVTYSGSMAVLYYVYPGTATTPLTNFVFLAAIALIAFLLSSVILPMFLVGGGGDGRVSLRAVMIPVLSIAKRSLKRRRLRFILTLISLSVLVMSFVALTSMSEGYGLISRQTSRMPSPIDGVLIRSSTWTEAEPAFLLSRELELEWLRGREEVIDASEKLENPPQTRPLASIQGNPIMAVVGVDPKHEPKIAEIMSTLIEGNIPGPGGVALSEILVGGAGLKIGDMVRIRSETLKIEGIMSDSAFNRLLDLDGGPFIPAKWVNTSPPGEPPSYMLQQCDTWEVAIVDVSTALRYPQLGVTRIALAIERIQPDILAERLALERGYQTWAASKEGVIFIRIGSYFEGKGLPLVIPWAIVVLNVVLTILNSLFERRKEIGILSAVGLNPAEIASIFVTEVSITGFIAGGMGYLTGLGLYKLMPILGLTLEVHQKVSAFWSLAAIGISISAVLVGAFAALKSSVIITPSLTRRWKMDESRGGIGKPWDVPIPVKLEQSEVNGFFSYLLVRLRRLEDDQVRKTDNIKINDMGQTKVITFIYKSPQSTTGNFYTRNTITLEPDTSGTYQVKLESHGGSEWAHETGTLIRLIVMEWSNRQR